MGIHHKIHWLLPDFPISKDIPWLFTEFPDFSLTLKNNNFPDFSLTAGNPEQMLQHHKNCQYLVPNIMQNMKTNKVYKKIFGKWYLNENLI